MRLCGSCFWPKQTSYCSRLPPNATSAISLQILVSGVLNGKVEIKTENLFVWHWKNSQYFYGRINGWSCFHQKTEKRGLGENGSWVAGRRCSRLFSTWRKLSNNESSFSAFISCCCISWITLSNSTPNINEATFNHSRRDGGQMQILLFNIWK